MCWVTDQLKLEIGLDLPNPNEISIDTVTGICTHDLEAFKFKCSAMFPKGRIFMSDTQLDQCAKYFLDGWNVKKYIILRKSNGFMALHTKAHMYLNVLPKKTSY